MFCIRMVGTRTEQLWTIRNPNMFGIRAPTVSYLESRLKKFLTNNHELEFSSVYPKTILVVKDLFAHRRQIVSTGLSEN